MTIELLSKQHKVDTSQSLLTQAQTLISKHKLSADYIKALYNIEVRHHKGDN